MSGDAPTATVTLTTTVASAGDYAVSANVRQLIGEKNRANNTVVVKAAVPQAQPAPPTPQRPVRPVIARPILAPAQPMRRQAARRHVRRRPSFKDGLAQLALVIARNARGRRLRLKLTIKTGSQAAISVVTFRIH